MKTKNKNRINYFLQSLGVSKPFKVIFTNFFLLKNKNWEIQFYERRTLFFQNK